MGLIFKKSVPVAALFLLILPAVAHHSRTIFDYEQLVTVEGVVTKYEFANPHIHLYVETETDAGEAVVWAFETGPTTTMRRRGWSDSAFFVGDRVIVEGHPMKVSGTTTAAIADNSVRIVGAASSNSAGLAAAVEGERSSPIIADGLSGVWEVPRTSFIDEFSEPFDWALTDKGAEALSTYDDLTMNPQTRCMARSVPWVMIFSGVQEIAVGDSEVSIRTEYDTVDRLVHMDAASHDNATVSYHGHSIGWWEGDALVVDTTHFAGNRNGNARGVQSGPQKHLVERFELNPDRTRLTYSFELADPEYLAATVTGQFQSTYRPDLEFDPIACDPEIARRFLGD
ncbi:MAG: DUF6152 family protein [Candidatus Rariloculaceae bacterium]